MSSRTKKRHRAQRKLNGRLLDTLGAKKWAWWLSDTLLLHTEGTRSLTYQVFPKRDIWREENASPVMMVTRDNGGR